MPVKYEVPEPACVLGKLLNLVKLKGVFKPQGDEVFLALLLELLAF